MAWWGVVLVLVGLSALVAFLSHLQCLQARDYLRRHLSEDSSPSSAGRTTVAGWLNAGSAVGLGVACVWLPWLVLWTRQGQAAFSLPALFFVLPTIVVLPPLVLATVVDGLMHRLPNRLLASASASFLLTVVAVLILNPNSQAILRGVCCGLMAFVALFIARWGGMGMGDVKLGTLIALWLGWYSVPTALWGFFLAVIGAGLWALWGVARKKLTAKSPLAFGPWLLGGAILAWFATAANLTLPALNYW